PNGSDGALVDLVHQQRATLPGSRSVVAFSGDGTTIAWVNSDAASPSISAAGATISGVSSVEAMTLSAPAGDSVTSLALSNDGSLVATVINHHGSSQLAIEQRSSGTVLATGSALSSPVFAPDGSSIAGVISDSGASSLVS